MKKPKVKRFKVSYWRMSDGAYGYTLINAIDNWTAARLFFDNPYFKGRVVTTVREVEE